MTILKIFNLLPCDLKNNQNLYKDIEIDEFFTYQKSKNSKIYVWLAVCRHSMEVIAFHVSTKRSKKAFTKLFNKIKHLNILNIHTDKYKAYNDIYKTHNHTTTKAETYSVESTNNRFRHKLARFKRKSISYSKDIANLSKSVSMLSVVINSDIKTFNNFHKIFT